MVKANRKLRFSVNSKAETKSQPKSTKSETKESSEVLACAEEIVAIFSQGKGVTRTVFTLGKTDFDKLKAKFGDNVYPAFKYVGKNCIEEGEHIFGKVYGLIPKE